LRRTLPLFVAGLFLLSAVQCDAQIFHKKKKVNKSTSADNTAEPDKILYTKSMDDIKHGRHEVGRLNLQTLINTYPDSEFLADAKMAIADSYYKEGGTANTTQAVQAYKDFIVFFPMMLQKAAYAQLQVAMAHYRQMEKPDRDRTHAKEAEDEFQTFLTKYPKDPLVPKAEQHLREVQEVLAEGDYRIGYFYYVKGDKRAAESRLRTVVTRYPLYSKADQALWMLGGIWEGTEKKELSAPYYARIVRNYPLSTLAPDAKAKLKALGAPVPQPDPKAVAWMQAEKTAPRQRETLIKKPLALVNTKPRNELVAAAKSGTPTMTPETGNEAGTDILRGGNQSGIGGAPGMSLVTTVTPGGAGGTAENAESVTPAAEGSDPKAETQADPNAPPASDAAAAGTADGAPKSDGAATGATDTAPKTDGTAADGGTDAAKTDAAPAKDGTGTDADKKKESTSKKKKGLKKIIPW
jgi:outer membrane protein assembly factor BamD